MKAENKTKILRALGLTGNIGCGKSTVASLLSKYPNVFVLDCDVIAKKVLHERRYKRKINAILKTDAFIDDKPDLKLIAMLIFENPKMKMALEKLIHPIVWDRVREKVNQLNSQNDGLNICIVESAIIYETDKHELFDGIITVTCPLEEQFRRLKKNRKMSHDEIRIRIDQQMQPWEKAVRAQYVIDTGCRIDQLRVKVKRLYRQIKQERKNK